MQSSLVAQGLTWYLPSCAGTYEEAHKVWEALCPDARQAILSKLSLREVARTAPTSRDFQQACVSRAAEERAKLIALGKEAYGRAVFFSILKAVRRSLRGLSPFPELVWPDQGQVVIVDTAGNPKVGRVSSMLKMGSAVVEKCLYVGGCATFKLAEDVKGEKSGRGMAFTRLQLDVSRVGANTIELKASFHGEAAAATQGLLMFMCTETPEAMSLPSSVKLNLTILSLSPGSLGKKAAEDVAALLMPLAEVCCYAPHASQPVPRAGGRKARPEGVINCLRVAWQA
jgi:hypothetical protein